MNEPDITNRELSKQIGDLRKDVNQINTALYGTGNPHGGLFGEFKVLEGKVTTLSTEIKGLEKTLTAKIDGVKEIFVKMLGLFKWSVGIAAVPFCAIVIPIFIEVVLPILRKWIGV